MIPPGMLFDVLCLSCNHGQFHNEGAHIQIFQDLSAITLQHRRHLCPLVNALHDSLGYTVYE